MKKSIFLIFAAILCSVSAWAAVTFTEEAVIYFTMENDNDGSNWWNNSGCYHYAKFKGASGTTDATVHLYNIDDRDNSASAQTNAVFFATIPAGTYSKISFYRGKTAATLSSYHNAATDKVDLQADKNKFGTIYNENFGNWQSWSKTQETSTVALSASSNNVNENDVVTLTPSLTTNADLNKIKSVSYSIAPNSGASIDGNEFKATAAGTYTVTATITYNAKGFVDITKTTTATTTISVKSAAEETHDVTVSYMFGSTKVADPTTVNTVGVNTPVKVTAPEIAKYTFANWTLGADVATTDALTSNEIKITTKAGGSDFTLVANYEKAKLTYTVTVPAGTENCYLVGAMNGWDEKNPYEMTKQSENVFTVTLEGVEKSQEYKYLSQKGTWDYEEVGGNRTWTANDVVTAWKDPLATNVHLAGTMTDWDNNKIEFKKATKEATTASIILNLTAGDYKFKIVDNGSWLGNNATIDKTISGWTFAGDKGDCPLKATIAGDYTFTWAISTKKLSVTYPTICAITATANDAAMGTIAGAGNYGKGSTATLTATPNDGYLFVNWTKDGVEVATTQEYSFKVTEAVALVANFEAAPEEVHNVTVSYVCGGNKIADDQTVAAVGETSAKTVEAPAIFGYTFASWTLGADVTTDDALTSNAIDINIVAGGSNFTLTANYTEVPKVTIYFVNNQKWSKVYAYGWGGSVGETPVWPGAEITENKEVEQIAGFDVHSYSVVPGSYVNIKFTNNSGTESANFKWTDGKYYYMDAANDYVGGTKEEVTKELTPTYTVAGDNRIVFGEEWAPSKVDNDMVDQGDGTYKWTKSEIALKKNTQIKFKVVKNHDWGKGSWPGEDWVINTISKDGYYTITIIFKESDKSITATATWTGEAPFKDFSNQPATLYFHPSFHWTSDNAEFAAYFYNEGFGADAEPKWADMTDSDGDGVYEVANAKQHEYVIICRMNPSRTENKWDDAVSWNKIETGITIPNTAGDLNTCLAFWTNCQGNVPTSECTWVAPTPLTDKNWDAFIAAYNGKTINAVVERSFKSSQLHTICLPFDLSTSWLGDGAQAHQITSVVSRTAEELELKTTQCNTLFAGQPYIIQPIKGEEYEHIIVSNVTVENVTASEYTVLGGGCKVTMQAVSATDGTQTNGTTEYYIGAKDGKLYKEATNKLGLRALVVMTDTDGQQLSVRARVVVGENEETGIENIITTDTPVKVIENGQLIIIRDGEKFNAQGQKL